jgi:two-component system phosphate regulon response regulator PhoB
VTTRSLNVLIADDEPSIRTLLDATIGRSGTHAVSQAANGEEALRLARQIHPDLMLLDVRMPRLDGVDVCRRLKGDPATADIKIVFLTAFAQDHMRREAEAAGADLFLVKPFKPNALLDILDGFSARGTLVNPNEPEPTTRGKRGKALSLADLDREQLEIYAHELAENHRVLQETKEQLEVRVRELEALNKLFREHLNHQATAAAEFSSMARDIAGLSAHVSALAERADTLAGHWQPPKSSPA